MDLWKIPPGLQLIPLATVLALALAIPAGILASRAAWSIKTRPLADFIQTMPPYVYLIPA
jgi:glycine betaine/proline transport system permease protein